MLQLVYNLASAKYKEIFLYLIAFFVFKMCVSDPSWRGEWSRSAFQNSEKPGSDLCRFTLPGMDILVTH